MNSLTLTLIQLGFLAVLWLFVIAAVGVVRTDMFGPGTPSRRQARKAQRRAAHASAVPSEPVAPAAVARQARQARQANAPRQARSRRDLSRVTLRELVVTAGPLAGTTLPLTDQQITIGRASDATLVLNDDYASGRHARLYPQDGTWFVEDLGSTNGTYLDSEKVASPVAVPPDVPIRIGKTVLELRR